ncbi:hypothetical protein N0V88_008126 [Collariella sp. IMI 366227]|nr:hypothetical protein N0V88_008126 [Collariella sp. IMI 366227]
MPAIPQFTTVSLADGITGLTARLRDSGQLLTDQTIVLYAVNLSGQQRYRITPGGYNAYCWNGRTNHMEGVIEILVDAPDGDEAYGREPQSKW